MNSGKKGQMNFFGKKHLICCKHCSSNKQQIPFLKLKEEHRKPQTCVINNNAQILTTVLAFFQNLALGSATEIPRPGLTEIFLDTPFTTCQTLIFYALRYFSLKLVFVWTMLSNYGLLPLRWQPNQLFESLNCFKLWLETKPWWGCCCC